MKKSKTTRARKPADFPKDFEPFIFEMGIFPDENGGLAIRYESCDDRADVVCPAIIEAVAESIGFVADLVEV